MSDGGYAWWPRAVGVDIAAKVHVHSHDPGSSVLTLATTSNGWAQQMNRLLGPVTMRVRAVPGAPRVDRIEVIQPFVTMMVTGSRKWGDRSFVDDALLGAWHDVTQVYGPGTGLKVMHGDCREGVDLMADRWARRNRLPVVRMAAAWKDCDPADPRCTPQHRRVRRSTGEEYCPLAGMRRNQAMVDTGPDLCLAFIRDRSGGSSHALSAAAEARVPTFAYRTGVR